MEEKALPCLVCQKKTSTAFNIFNSTDKPLLNQRLSTVLKVCLLPELYVEELYLCHDCLVTLEKIEVLELVKMQFLLMFSKNMHKMELVQKKIMTKDIIENQTIIGNSAISFNSNILIPVTKSTSLLNFPKYQKRGRPKTSRDNTWLMKFRKTVPIKPKPPSVIVPITTVPKLEVSSGIATSTSSASHQSFTPVFTSVKDTSSTTSALDKKLTTCVNIGKKKKYEKELVNDDNHIEDFWIPEIKLEEGENEIDFDK